jgi:S1-C subfamily serine protease
VIPVPLILIAALLSGEPPQPATQPATQPTAQAAQADGAWLGVQIQPDENGQGLVVVGIVPNSPAAAAGFLNEDVITKVDGKDMKDLLALLARMRQTRPGDKLQFTVLNEGNERVVRATLAERPSSQPSQN